MPRSEPILERTRAWVAQAVVGLNLCPFAKAPMVKGQIRYALSSATNASELLGDLHAELRHLMAADPTQLETTLLVVPDQFDDFLDFNDFLDAAEDLLDASGLVGTVQLASFHPHYQFAGTEYDAIDNATNRSPYPTLHLLREASITRAVAAFREPEAIYQTNMQTLRELGPEGWSALCRRIDAGAQSTGD
jgi:hypothetical protein